jgi:hypothetical protein
MAGVGLGDARPIRRALFGKMLMARRAGDASYNRDESSSAAAKLNDYANVNRNRRARGLKLE